MGREYEGKHTNATYNTLNHIRHPHWSTKISLEIGGRSKATQVTFGIILQYFQKAK